MYFSSNQLDQLATMLEDKSGDVRRPDEASEERIVTSLEKLGNSAPVTGVGYAERVLQAVNGIDFSGGGSGGTVYVNGVYPAISATGALAASFEGDVEISPEVTSWSYMFSSLSKFNKPVTIPDGVTDAVFCFTGTAFNQPITIPNSVQSLNTFIGTNAFNSPVTISDGITNCEGLFRLANGYNLPVNIPDSVTKCKAMFEGATSFKQDIVFPANCNEFTQLFNYSNYYGTVYILNNDPMLWNMFSNCSNEHEKTVYLMNQSTPINWIVNTGHLINAGDWETVTNGKYNAYWNVRVLYNMPEELLS